MTSTTNAAVPLAETLDEAVLRTIFPGAPGDLSVPKDAGSIFKARMKGVGGERHGLLVWGSVALVVVALVLAFGGLATACGVILAVVGVAWIIVAFWQHSQAQGDFFGGYATARGLTHDDDNPRMDRDVPLFDKGDKRDWSHVMAGQVAGFKAKLGHYTYTVETRDSEGNRQETDHDYTVLAFSLPPEVTARFKGIYLSPKGWSLGALQDKLAHDRKVELESAEFSKRYSLRVVDDQDDIALYELFNPTFIHTLATELKVYWEQVGNDLVFWRKGHESEAADLDHFCQHGAYVLQRYLEEYR